MRTHCLVRVLALDADTAKLAAAIRGVLDAAGMAIGPMDVLISATALSHGAALVTHNTKEFSRVNGLGAEDWF
ncbi:MAG: type II toxin-antitoxin system VapC family toxin [Betaproteobacteria bacterium]|nr:type II toxin-antitoxin system VapC family toxin [Betaproteobacteria bacterium]